MSITRRTFVQAAAAAGATGLGLKAAAAQAADRDKHAAKRRQRTIYFNDARHYYLYVFEPPMTLQDAWRPVDEVAGTAVDTFTYGVERGDGLFYPSKVGMRFGQDMRPFTSTFYWRVWENMQSLIDRGLDPLKVLIDRAHDKGMEFFASLRMSAYGGMDPRLKVPEGGRGLAHEEVRDHQFAVLKELATEYEVEGLELDFAAAPAGMPPSLRPEDVPKYTPVLTDYVRKIAKMARGRDGEAGKIGARVYPTLETCKKQGLDVPTWLKEGLVDYVVPMLYADFTLDADMPIDWLIEAAHEADVPVYGMLQPYARSEASGAPARMYATAEMLRAAAANYWAGGVDGLYTWLMQWPLGDEQRQTLTELGDRDLVLERDKHYVVRRRSAQAADMGYDAALPIEVPSADPGKRYAIPFHVADDVKNAKDRIRQMKLLLSMNNLMSADRLTVLLNGKSLASQTCLRDFNDHVAPYRGQLLELYLKDVRPHKGKNVLEISLDERPAGMAGGVSIEHVELLVKYGSYPSALSG